MTDQPPFKLYETHDGMLEDTSITPTHLADIFAQHATEVSKPPIEIGNDTHDEMSVSSASPTTQDKSDSLQAKPEGENQFKRHHE